MVKPKVSYSNPFHNNATHKKIPDLQHLTSAIKNEIRSNDTNSKSANNWPICSLTRTSSLEFINSHSCKVIQKLSQLQIHIRFGYKVHDLVKICIWPEPES